MNRILAEIIERTCLNCGKVFYKKLYELKRNRGVYCSRSCSSSAHWKGIKNPRWNGGKTIHEYGYILVKAPEDHPYANKHGYIREHRLVMEKKLGRYMTPEENTHHINGDVTDNRIENLELMSNRGEHLKKEHALGTYTDHLIKLNSRRKIYAGI